MEVFAPAPRRSADPKRERTRVMVRRFAFGWGVRSVAALCAVWCGSAQAETAAEILSTFNLVTEGNATTASDIEGSTVVGGDLLREQPSGNPSVGHLRESRRQHQPDREQAADGRAHACGSRVEHPLQRALHVHLAPDLAVERLYGAAERAID